MAAESILASYLLDNINDWINDIQQPEARLKALKILASTVVIRERQIKPWLFVYLYRKAKLLKPVEIAVLEEGILNAAQLLSGFERNKRIIIASDISASMQHPLTSAPYLQRFDVGILLSMLLQDKCRRLTSGFIGNTFKPVNFPKRNVLQQLDNYRGLEGSVGYACYVPALLNELIAKRKVVDKIFILTDQDWDDQNMAYKIAEQWKAYKQIAPAAKLYWMNLSSSKGIAIRMDKLDLYVVEGWSDTLFDILQVVQGNPTASEVQLAAAS